MSVWKKVSKINQKRHRERHQPSRRENLGLLEKHQDYVKRAKDFHKKDKIIKKLKEKVLNKNPNEYYHHMVNSELRNDIHTDKSKGITEHTIEQKLILEHKNISYVDMKLNMERKKLEQLKSGLHLIDFSQQKTNNANNSAAAANLLKLDEKTLKASNKLKQKKYKELIKRIERRKQLALIKEKMEAEKNFKETKNVSRPKLISAATKTKAAVYEWKYERKK